MTSRTLPPPTVGMPSVIFSASWLKKAESVRCTSRALAPRSVGSALEPVQLAQDIDRDANVVVGETPEAAGIVKQDIGVENKGLGRGGAARRFLDLVLRLGRSDGSGLNGVDSTVAMGKRRSPF